MDIWLASFPRSGNTFFRNVLYNVYGLESSTFHIETAYPVDENYDQYPIVKTHLLPTQIVPDDPNIPSVYIVRDGRDAIVSLAHYRKDITAPGTQFYHNLKEAIIAAEGSFFGGWSENVKQWITKADLVIRFEDLIKDPIKQTERLSKLIELPSKLSDQPPTFEELKFGKPQYGSGKAHFKDETKVKETANRNFRKGKVGSWKEEMPEDLQELFWNYHGAMMEEMGYTKEGEVLNDIAGGSYSVRPKVFEIPKKTADRKKVLIEGSKLWMAGNDGVKRYLNELLKEYLILERDPYAEWSFDLLLDFETSPLSHHYDAIFRNDFVQEEESQEVVQYQYEHGLLSVKDRLKRLMPSWLYEPLASIYRALPFRYLLKRFREAWSGQNLTKSKIRKLLADYDVVHVPLPQHLTIFKNVPSKYVTTVHDMTHLHLPEFHQKDNVALATSGTKLIDGLNSNAISVSEATAMDFKSESSLAADRHFTVLEGVDHNRYKINCSDVQSKIVRDKYNLPNKPYLLSLSTIEPRKNIMNTIKAFKQLISKNPESDVHLFICGQKGWKSEALFDDLELQSDRIVFTGFIEEDHLPVLYSDAIGLCYASFYEGFGLPMLEAMRCGTPVIYGNNSSMPEIGGEGGIPVDPNDINAISDAMTGLVFDKDFRQQMEQKALDQSMRFSWRKAALGTLEVYEKIISAN